MTDLYEMLGHGYFAGVYLDEANRKMAFPKPRWEAAGTNRTCRTGVAACRSCGADHTVTAGVTDEC